MQNIYWKKELKDLFLFNNFSKKINENKNFDDIKIYLLTNNDLELFLKENNISFFEFYTSILSLYLSRISRSEGIIFTYNNRNSNDTLFKIRYNGNNSLLETVFNVKNVLDNSLKNSMENLKEYVDESYPEYSDYIFNYSLVDATKNSNINNDSSIRFIIFKDSIEIEYDKNTFKRIEIKNLLENIEYIIKNFLKNINQSCCDITIVCDRQLKLINEFSKGSDFEIKEKLLPNIICDTAKKYPDNFAINDEKNRITYKELDNLINSTTYILQNEYGISKSDKIILNLSKSYNMPLLTICLMKLGAITIPIDDTYPKSYIQSIIDDSSIKYIIQEIPYEFDNVESIELNSLQKSNKIGSLVDVDVDLDDTALILYTSGVTGIPKGVEITQRNIININYNYINYFNIDEGSTGNFMCLSKFTFVASLPIYAALMHGCEAFIIREASQKTIPRIVKYLMDYHCYVLISTQELGLYLYNNFDLNLDVLVFAGSSLTKANIRKDSSTELMNAYGCTETSGSVIINKLNHDFSNHSVIGKHLGNSKVYILDENKKHLPIGSVGEIVISGPCVSKKYFNNPEQTDKAYGKFNNEKVYFTNDLGYFDNNGDVVYLGRKDNQINLNGFRIEPEGIESVIFEYGNINKVKVTVREVNHQNHLIAYYSSNDNIDKNSLKKYLKHHLPNYMVPSFYMQIKDFPLNQNGKIDVEKLPHIEFNEVEFVLPHDEYEEIIVNSFKKFFNKNKISIYDDFIQLGGNSVTAMKILSELNEFNLTINELITLRTPEKIAKHMKNHALPNFDWEKYSLNDACPLNESQLNVYLDIQRYEKNENYNIPITIHIDKSYSINDIKNALSKIFNVHPILKTHIEIIEGKPYLKSENIPKIKYLKEHDENMINKFMMDHFDLNESLSRFLLVENEDNFVLFAVFHHLIFDGFSSLVFRKHLFDLLNGEILNTDVEFIKSSIYDEEIIKNPKYKEAEIFYETMLYEVDEVSPFLSSVKNNKSSFYYFDLSINENNIKDFLKSNNITENILFISAFAYTLSRFTGDSQALFNILDNGRDILNNYESIGMFVNTLPLLVDCFDEEITSFISEVKELLLKELSYNFYPFRVLANKYNLNSSILFQYLPDIDDETEQLYNISDLEFRVFKNNNGYSLKVIYSDEYSSEIIKKFVESYNMILIQILCVDKLSEINYITSSDVELLNSYNQTEHSLEYRDILDAFNDNLSKYSDNTLLGFKNRNYTHGEGAYIANEISNMLHSLGIVKQDYVALFVPRSEWFLLASLGVLTCGAIYVPIETTYPDERILLMLSDTQSKVVIVTDKTQQHIKDLIDKNKLNIKILNVSKITKKTIKSINHLNYETVDTNDIACVLYTSGSTGTPKGVLITRKAINNFVTWYVNETDFTSNDVYGMYCSYVFDMHTHALYSPIITGGSLYIVPEDIRLDLKALNDFYVKWGCTHTYITSQVGKLFAESGMETTIKLLCFGGMKLGDLNAPDSIGPFESYGPSENLAITTSIFANKRIHNSSIGHFINNVKGYVLDNEQRRVPLGAVGELYLSGHQLTPGYLNHNKENEKVFFDNPFDNEKGYEHIYKTGDIVRFLPDGTLGIIGRRDNQVKIRGNRVELSEVETTIRKLDYVNDVTVQTIKNMDNTELVAYIVSPDINENNLIDSVREYISKHKPDYMVPSFIIKLNEIPLTINGKVDKQALPDVNLNTLHAEYVAPKTKTEQIIVDIFKEIFQQEKISLNDDFIRLGGDSITAIRMISSLQKYNISCTAKNILTYKTPYLISQHIKIDTPTQSYENIEGTLDLLPIQSYFFDQINEDNFTQQFVLKTNEDLDINILQNSFDELCNVHDMLRAVYTFDEKNNPIQEILPINTHICDIKEQFISKNFNKKIKDILIESIQQININSKLIDINLVHHNNENYIIIVIHHLIIDGISWNTLLDDLTNIYLKLLKGEKINLKRPYSYKSWIEDVKNLVDDITDHEKNHWIEVNNLLDDSLIKGDADIFTFNVESYFDVNNLLMMSEEEYLALAIARAYKKTYDKDIIFNRESHGRDDSITNINKTIGWFTSQYPVPVKTNNRYDAISLIKDIYSIKTAFKDVNHLGLNYASLIYTTQELEFKHCPITFNFLSNEFEFKNKIFESINHHLFKNEINDINLNKSKTYGITLNISHIDKSYIINGKYADNTYLSDKFNEFIENIKFELKFIGEYEFKEIICTLSESQLGVYLDEKVNNKDTAYSVPGILECNDKPIEEIKNAINILINKHPILKGRILDYDLPLLICDTQPPIETVNVNDYYELIKPFDLDKNLVRFYIIDNNKGRFLFYDMHHIISDATSRIIINKKLKDILNGKFDSNIDLGFVYSSNEDFESKFRPEYESAHNFFIESFTDIDDIHPILTDINGCEGTVSLPIRGIQNKINSFTHKMGITNSTLLNIVFAYTYSRFTGEDKVYYTFTEHGRHENYTQDSLGMFIRTIPIIADCKNKSTHDFLHNMADLILNSMLNSIYPFRLLAKEFNLNNEVSFEYNYDLNDVSDIKDKIVFNDNANLVSEFSCIVNDLEDGFVVNVSHTNKFSQDTAMRFANVFKEVLTQILDKKELCDINYISNDDIKLLNRYNKTENELKYNDILDAFNDNLFKYSDNTLLGFKNRNYTHGEGAYIANEISNMLHSLGIVKQDYVALFVPRSEWFLLASLGVLTCGAIYVPIETTYPDERILLMLSDTQSKVVIVTDKTQQHIKDLIDKNKLNIKILNVSKITKKTIKSINHLNYETVDTNDIACVLYTSGSTGTPKGVLITRKAINNFVTWYVNETDFTSNDVYGMYCSYVFDMHTHALYSPIITGGSLYIVPEDIRLDLKALNDFYVKWGCTHTYITSQVGKLFAESGMETTIKLLCFGGMKLGDLNAPDSIGPFESYGPSENLAITTSIFANKRIHNSSIGHFINNVKGYVLDNEQRRVPLGAVGELYLSGHQLTPGYLNHNKENEKVFFDNPFDNEKGYEHIYKTGDIVRFLPDGTLGIIGRRDNQVKIRGNRVELSEVETTIRKLDYVNDVTVQTIKNMDNTELVAYIVSPDINENNLIDSVREYISKHKPDYMVPSFIIKLNEIPLTINGKVDKQALPDVNLNTLHAEYVAPKTKTEQIIVDIFKEIFQQEKISLNDDFIRLGGDSITAIRMISSLQKYNISCTAKNILTYKTPYLISQHIKIDTPTQSYENIEGTLDLLPIQSYFFDQINEDNFTQQFVLKTNEDLDINILQNSFDELCNVHDMLRAVYTFDEKNNPIQEILPINTHICDIKEQFISKNFNKKIKDILIESIQQININSKLIDINLVHHNNENYIIIVIHHLIIDGISWNTLLDDLTNIYLKLLKGEKINLKRPYSYKSWIEDVKNLVDDITDHEKNHWIEVNNLLDDSLIKGDADIFTFNVESYFDVNNLLMMSEEEYLALAIARAYKKTYDKDIIFNRESHGRDDSITNINKTIGWFTSQYPVPVKTNNRYDAISLIKDIYSIKTAFKDVNHLGLNYASLIYTTQELEFKHCPITFNFLSNEFEFKNKIFESINHHLFKNEINDINLNKSKTYGITLNISHIDKSYIINGKYADNTYLSDKFNEFIENIKFELKFIGEYEFKEIICTLSESQLGVYLDEKVNNKDTAYSVPGILECNDKPIEEIKNAINILINKHPILKGRILDYDLPLLICDTQPPIETVNVNDYYELIKPFDLDKNLVRFYIIDNNKGRFLFYDMHHIISDATSRIIINKKLKDILNGKFDSNIDLGFVYSSNEDFESKFRPEYESAHNFFIESFTDIDDIHPILTDINGCEGTVSLPIRGIQNKINSFTHKMGITNSTLLNIVFAYTYSRFTGEDKVYYTFTEHGRHENYTQDSLGMFIRTIPIIADCKNKSTHDFLHNMADLILNSMLNSIYPFRLLAKEFNLNNEVSFEYNYDLNDVSDIKDKIVFNDNANLVSEFSCIVNDLEDGFVVNVSHTNKFSQDTAMRFANVFKEVLTQILDKKELCDINYISNDDIKLLNRYNKTENELKYNDILDAFNDNLNQYPNNCLVSMNNKSFTYAEGAFIADKIAKQLISLGIDTGDRVGFLVNRSELYMFCVLGILSVGGVYVPLDDKLPDERIKFILEDSNINLVIVSDKTYERTCNLNCDQDIINISEIITDNTGELFNLPIVYGELACILYTSGTTGIPKGVKITRKSIINLATFYIRKYALTNNDVYGLFASIGFDVAIKGIFSSILAGSSLNIIPHEIKLDINALNDYLIKYNITHTEITTQVAKLFIRQTDNTSLKVLTTGGEKLGNNDVDVKYRFVDSYGPTEACVDVTSIDVKDKIDSTSIGYLLDNTKAYILDNEFRRVPIGAVGELYVAGYQIAEGYLNRSKETNNAFINNPFDNNLDYNILYRTGDMVKVLPDGSLAIVGRRDNQVKIRGNRVELSEIESTIRELDYVDDVTVQIVNNQLASYIVTKDDISEDELFNSIHNFVSAHKPNYMVPSFVIKLDFIPLTINGKINKNALPKPKLNKIEIINPQNDIEKKLLDICIKLSDISDFGVTSNLFNIGFSSLTFMKLNHEILKEYNVDLSIGFLLNKPYIRDISEAIDNKDSYCLKSYPPQKYYPLTSMQKVMTIFSHSNLSKQKFVLHDVVSLNRLNDVNKLKNSIIKVINTHTSMKTRLIEKNNEIIQKRDDNLDISQFIEIKKVDEITDELLNDTIFDFNIFEDILFRFTIYQTKNDVKLVSNIHHIIMDVYSIKLLIEDIKLAYDNEKIEKELINMYDVTLNELEYENSIQYKQSEEYYLSILNEYEEVKLPKNQEDYSTKENSNICSIDIDNIEIEEFCSENNISPSILFMASTLLTLDKFTYSTKSSLSNIYNGRYNASLYKTYGELSKELLLIINRDNRDETIKILFEKINIAWNNALKHSMYPIEKLYSKENISSTVTYRYFEDYMPSFLEFENLTSTSSEIDRDLEIAFIKTDKNKFIVHLNYNLQLYTTEYIETFLNSLKTIILFIINCNIDKTKLKDISLSKESLGDFDEDIYIPTLVELFEKQVSINPDKTALIINDEKISYYELNQNANKIANSLIDKVPSKSNIVVLLPRNKELMYVIWGILKADCSFIPLDESYPENRIKYIIKNSNSSIVITDKELPNSIHPNTLLNCKNNKNPNLDIIPDDLAYILYTSGTTGKPKGVKVSHKNIVNITMPSEDNILNQAFTNNVNRLLTLTHVNYTPSVIDYTTALTSGITVVYANNDEIININSLIRLIGKYKPEIIGSITPSRLTEFLEFSDFIEVFQHLKKVVLLGEKFPPILYSKIRSKHKSIEIYNDYGSTESVGIGLKEVTNENDITIGLPMHNVKRYIVDIDEQILPPLVQGHLYISGPSVSLGYTNVEENEKTYTEFNNKRFIKTGDLAILQPNSEIKLYGRVDKQLKLRGQRLESEEIITLINKYPNITNSIITINEINNFEHLIAYYVSTNQINENDLRSYLEKKLPMYMIPTHFIEIPEIPTNLHGKVDSTKLPKLNLNELNYEAPTNDLEKRLIGIAKKLTNIERIGINTNLVSIGFTSLTFMNFNYEIFKAFNVELNIDILLSKPFIKDIAETINNTEKSIKSYPIQKYYPLTTMQEVMFTFSHILKKSVTISDIVNINPNMDANKLKNAILKTINTKTSIKTQFVKKDGKVMQYRDDDLNINHLVELKKVDEITEELIIDALYEFNLLNENLFHFTIYQSDNEIKLVFSIHHILVDLYSLKLFFDDVLKVYNGKELDKEIVNLFDFTIAESKFLNSKQYKEAENYYLKILNDYEDVKLPKNQNKDIPNKILKGTSDNLNEVDIISFCNQHNISPSVLFMTSTLLTLDKFTDSSKSLLTNIYNGRHSSSIYQTFGNLSRELPLIVNRKNRNQSIKSLLTSANTNWNTALKYGMYPFERMFHEKNIQFSTITYRYFEDFIPELLKNDIIFNESFIGDRDLEIYFIRDENNKFIINVSYNTQLYSDKYMNTFIKSVKNTIKTIITCDILKMTINDISKINEIENSPKKTNTKIIKNANYEAPSNELEKTIVNAFEFAFNQKIGMNDDFVSLGGTSLTSMIILRYLYDYGIEDIDLFKLRTPKSVAEFIKTGK